MHKADRSKWLGWQVTPANVTADPAVRFQRPSLSTDSATLAQLRAEAPGPDGIRHALVARIRAEIVAGTYDTEEKWLLAEDHLCRAAAGSR
jgi:Anti-sigma-28 factor, FlgM